MKESNRSEVRSTKETRGQKIKKLKIVIKFKELW